MNDYKYMEMKMTGNVIDRFSNNSVIDFTIRVDDKTYKVSNCRRGNTEQNVTEEGIEYYLGNIDISDDGVIKTISSTLWVKPDNKCVCIFQK